MVQTRRPRHPHPSRPLSDLATTPSAAPSVPQPPDGVQNELTDHDDTCPICLLLLCHPVTTRCSHTLCSYCMEIWADVSITSQMTVVGLDDDAASMTLLPNEIETRCPMCRTPTTASVNQDKESTLRQKYPTTYRQREREERAATEEGFTDSVETLTLYIGNTHQLIRPSPTADGISSRNKHSWKFFVRPSRTDIIEEVHIFLHPTFRTSSIVKQYPPYEIHRLGWGLFTIYVNVILKVGYSWMSSEAEDAPDGGKKGKLPLEWTLNFDGRGRQGRCRLKIRKEKEGVEGDVVREGERRRELWARQREEDLDYVDPAEDAG